MAGGSPPDRHRSGIDPEHLRRVVPEDILDLSVAEPLRPAGPFHRAQVFETDEYRPDRGVLLLPHRTIVVKPDESVGGAKGSPAVVAGAEVRSIQKLIVPESADDRLVRHLLAVGARVAVEIVQPGELGKPLKGMGRLEGPGRMRQDHRHIRVILAVVTNPLDILRIGHSAGAYHVQRDGQAFLMGDLYHRLGQVVGDLSFPGRLDLGIGVVTLEPRSTKPLDLFTHPFWVVLWAQKKGVAEVGMAGGGLRGPRIGLWHLVAVTDRGNEQSAVLPTRVQVLDQAGVFVVSHRRHRREELGQGHMIAVPDVAVGIEDAIGNEGGQLAGEKLVVFLAGVTKSVVFSHDLYCPGDGLEFTKAMEDRWSRWIRPQRSSQQQCERPRSSRPKAPAPPHVAPAVEQPVRVQVRSASSHWAVATAAAL